MMTLPRPGSFESNVQRRLSPLRATSTVVATAPACAPVVCAEKL
jgi:hypothetical protein